jgi:hypothetical protein
MGGFWVLSHFRAQSQEEEGFGTMCNRCIMVSAVEGDRWKKGSANENFDPKKRRNIKVYGLLIFSSGSSFRENVFLGVCILKVSVVMV